MTNLHDLDAAALAAAFADGSATPVDALDAVLARCEAVNPAVNAVCALDIPGARAAAEASALRWSGRAPRGPLDGIPVTVKDLTPARGMPLRLGTPGSSPEPLEFDAPAVARLREAGAVIFAKTTTSEFGVQIVTETALTGLTRNPWNLSHHAGGSSGGAGAAVAAGIGPLALATDGGGSIRIPSGWCGVVGFKPSFKRVPTGGGEGFGSLANTGPIARTVRDAAAMLNVMAQRPEIDWQGMETAATDYTANLTGGLAGLRIAFSPDLGICEVDPQVAARLVDAVALLRAQGAEVEEIAVPPMEGYVSPEGYSIHGIQWICALQRSLSRLPPAMLDQVAPEIRKLAAIADDIPLSVYTDALATRERMAQEMHMLVGRYDALVLPTFHVPAPPAPGMPASIQGTPPLTSWANQTMQPALSVPCGLTDAGLPVGLQIVARRYADAMVLRIGAGYEAARGRFPAPVIADAVDA
ncbi:amidase family protein [Pseudooceanicola sp. C21-150M6]|uniref:amidase family protein n=1 Tax=Pseudooceanicola sp. C21-150M6 TaxID=3434355 RepID=UPI003D7FAC38